MAAFLRPVNGVATNAASVNIGDGSGNPQPGDVRFVVLQVSNGSTIFVPSGWSTLSNVLVGTYTYGVFYRPYLATQGVQNWGFTGASDFAIEIASVAGADTAATPQFTVANGSGTGLTATGLTPSAAGSVEVAFFSTAVGTNATTATLSTPSGMTLADTQHPSTAAGVISMVASRFLPTAAATGNSTSTASTTGQWRAAVVTIPSGPVAATAGAGVFLPFFGGGL